ncbi:unnamed protein product [Rhodiola kirilowii]
MDKSWMGLERSDTRYIQGIDDFVKFAKQNGGNSHIWPCRRCLMIRGRITTKEMFVHLINNGMMKGYNTWTSHGEDSNEPSPFMMRKQWIAERYGESSSGMMHHHQSNPTDDIIRDAFPLPHMQNSDHQMDMNIESSDLDIMSRDTFEKYTSLVCEAQTPLYTGCKSTVLETILRSMQMKVESRLSDKSFNKHLQITKQILPPDNNYPSCYKDVKKVLKNLGLGYETIHACEQGCILYYKEHKDRVICPVCGVGRYIENESKSKIPKKTLKDFPLTPRLQRLYMSPHIAGQMRWHARREVDDPEYIRHLADGESWQLFDKEFPEFASEIRNVRLGLATDGFNPFGA